MHRVFLNVPSTDSRYMRIDGDVFHHLVAVLRHRVGDRFSCLHPDGVEYVYTIVQINRNNRVLKASRDKRIERCTIGNHEIYLYPSLLKAQSFTVVLRKTTELGVTRINPVITTRSVSRIEGDDRVKKKLSRWKAILKDATEQCGRMLAPWIEPPETFSQSMEHINSDHHLFFLDAAGEPLVNQLISCTADDRLPDVSLFVGPEGGYTQEEKARLIECGAGCAALGSTVLRADTACVAAVAIVAALYHSTRYGGVDTP